MPVPKRKTSKSRRDKRQSCKFIRPKSFSLCLNCSKAINPHQTCSNCGFYKGRKIMKAKLDRLASRENARSLKEKAKDLNSDKDVEGGSNE